MFWYKCEDVTLCVFWIDWLRVVLTSEMRLRGCVPLAVFCVESRLRCPGELPKLRAVGALNALVHMSRNEQTPAAFLPFDC